MTQNSLGATFSLVTKKSTYQRDNKIAYLMILPMSILLSIFVIWPLIYAIYLSTFKLSFYKPATFVGLQFYHDVLTSKNFWDSMGIGFYFAFLVVPLGLIIALLLASFIKTLGKGLSALMKTIIYIPTTISTLIASVLFVFVYQQDGLANWMLKILSLAPRAWLNDPNLVLPAIAVPALWLGFGITTLILLSGLLDIPESYYESAQLDGANFFQKTWFITIPLLKNVFLYLSVVGFTGAIQMIDLPLVMTQGGPVGTSTTPNLFIYNTFTDGSPYSTSFSLAAALLLFFVLGSITFALFKLINSDKAVDG
jgi:ABC-type sugar transport system permease subunit